MLPIKVEAADVDKRLVEMKEELKKHNQEFAAAAHPTRG